MRAYTNHVDHFFLRFLTPAPFVDSFMALRYKAGYRLMWTLWKKPSPMPIHMVCVWYAPYHSKYTLYSNQHIFEIIRSEMAFVVNCCFCTDQNLLAS